MSRATLNYIFLDEVDDVNHEVNLIISENIQQPWRIYFLRTNHLHVYCICRSWKEGICFYDDVKRPIEQFVRLHRSHRFFLPADFSCRKYFLCKCRSFRNSMIEESNTLLRYIYIYIVCEDAILRYTLSISERTKFDRVMSRQLYKRTHLLFPFHVFMILTWLHHRDICSWSVNISEEILSRVIFSHKSYLGIPVKNRELFFRLLIASYSLYFRELFANVVR